MPKRIVDGDALWRSEKIRNLPEEVQPEYANLIPLALANGVFEYNPERIWSVVYSYSRPNITKEQVVHFLDTLQAGGLLFVWPDGGKMWGYWVGINKPGRLPGPSRLGTHEAIGPNPPLDLVEKYEKSYMAYKSMDSIGIQKLLGFGFGLGSGLGVGLGSGAGTAPALESKTEEETNMSLRSEIQTECLRILGVMAPRTGHAIWAELKPFEEVYGADAVIEAFKTWAGENIGENINYPMSSFIRVATRYLRADLKSAVNPELDPLVVDMMFFADGNVGFDKAQVRELGKMLADFTSKEILLAFKEFYAKLDEFQVKQAAKKFIETAPYLIAIARRAKAEMDVLKHQIELAGSKLESEAAARIANADEEWAKSKEIDPLFDDSL